MGWTTRFKSSNDGWDDPFNTRRDHWNDQIRQLNAYYAGKIAGHITDYFKVIGNTIEFSPNCPDELKEKIINSYNATLGYVD